MEKTEENPKSEVVVGGKINWRQWIPNPEGFPRDMIELLDEVAGFPELAGEIRGEDSLEKFDCLTRVALNKGLINREEYRDIQDRKHSGA